MTLKEVISIAGAIIISLGGGGAIVLLLSSYIGKIWANRLLIKYKAELNKELEEIKNKHRTEIEHYKSELEKARGDYNRFSGKKFEIIKNTWSALFKIVEELKIYNNYSNKDYSSHLENHINVISKYMAVVKKNSLYFSEEARILLDEYIMLCSQIVSEVSEKANNDKLIKEFADIVKKAINNATKRENLLNDIKMKFRQELGIK